MKVDFTINKPHIYYLTVDPKKGESNNQITRRKNIKSEFSDFNLTEVYAPLAGNGLTRNRSGCIGFINMLSTAEPNFQAPSSRGKPFILLEDDATLIRHFPKSLDIPDNTDLLYLGLSMWSLFENSKSFEKTFAFEDVPSHPHLVRILNMLSTHAIMVCSNSGLDFVKKCMYEDFTLDHPWDASMTRYQSHVNVYAFREPLICQSGPDRGGLASTYRYTNFILGQQLDLIQTSLSHRFDVMAKILYVKYRHIREHTNFYKKLYEEHIITFNNGWEYPGTKTSLTQFTDSFDQLIESMIHNKFDKFSPIPLGSNGVILNGSHRLAVSLCLAPRVAPAYIHKTQEATTNYNFNFFRNRNSFWRRDNSVYKDLDDLYADTMALESIHFMKNIRAMVVFPAPKLITQIIDIIKEYGVIYYTKAVHLNKTGINNLTKELYRGEAWVGGMFPHGITGKTHCIAYPNGDFPTYFFLIVMNDLSKLVEMKERCRALFSLGKHSLHTSDYINDTFRIASALLNKNSVSFLNTCTNDISSPNQEKLITHFTVEPVMGHSVGELSMVREMFPATLQIGVNHPPQAGDIDIYNPTNYFYFNGYKFIWPRDISNFANFRQYFEKLKSFCKNNSINMENICVTSSAVLSVYGIRDCGDLDLYIDKQYVETFAGSIFDNHNMYTIKNTTNCFSPLHFEDIIHNPKNHFIYQDVKFCNLSIIRECKINRIKHNLFSPSSVLKDKADLSLIDQTIPCSAAQ